MDYIIEIINKLGPEILNRTHEHIFLVLIALDIALCIALPLGVYLAKSRLKALVSVIIGIAGVIQTVPSLAMVAFIVVLFALVALPSIGTVPAIVALVLYALLPILRNTYTGIRQVDSSVIEVARGMGMKNYQILLQVELPLSIPFIMAGVRIAAVWTIGVATLCGLIGAGGLGDLIIIGLRSIQLDYLLAGTVPAAILALVFDWLLGLIENWLTPEGLSASV
jgi:osmoprotectant transport system permease protein